MNGNIGSQNGTAMDAPTGDDAELRRQMQIIQDGPTGQDREALQIIAAWVGHANQDTETAYHKVVSAILLQRILRAYSQRNNQSPFVVVAQTPTPETTTTTTTTRTNGDAPVAVGKQPGTAPTGSAGTGPSSTKFSSTEASHPRDHLQNGQNNAAAAMPQIENGLVDDGLDEINDESKETTTSAILSPPVAHSLNNLIHDMANILRELNQGLTLVDIVQFTLEIVEGAQSSPATKEGNGNSKSKLGVGGLHQAAEVYMPASNGVAKSVETSAESRARLSAFMTKCLHLCHRRSIQIFQLAKDHEYLSMCVFKNEQSWSHLSLELSSWTILKSYPNGIRRDLQIATIAASIALMSVIFKVPEDAWSTANLDIDAAKPSDRTNEGPPNKRARGTKLSETRNREEVIFRLLGATNQLSRKLAWRSEVAFCSESSRSVIFTQIFALLYAIENNPLVQNAPSEDQQNSQNAAASLTSFPTFRTVLGSSIRKPTFILEHFPSIIERLKDEVGASSHLWSIPNSSCFSFLASGAKKQANGGSNAIVVDISEPDVLPESIEGDGGNLHSHVPPDLTDAMELNEWTISILSLSVIRPSDKLSTFLQGDLSDTFSDFVVPTINRAMERILEDTSIGEQKPPAVSVGSKDGQLYFDGVMTPDTQLVAAVVGLYYHSLEAILIEESVRLQTKSHSKLIRSIPFHRALLMCCYDCILTAVGASRKVKLRSEHFRITIYTLLHIFETTPYTYLKVAESFHRACTQSDPRIRLGSPLICGVPRILQKHLRQTEVQIMDSIIWAREPSLSQEGSLIQSISTLQQHPLIDGKIGSGSWPLEVVAPTLPEELEDLGPDAETATSPSLGRATATRESQFIAFIFRKVMQIAKSRIEALCLALGIPKEYPIMTQVWVAFRFLLRNHVELLYDRHIDHFVLCSIYAVCKIMKREPEITFSRIIGAYVAIRGQELGELACQRIVRQVCLLSETVRNKNELTSSTEKPVGNIIDLYNRVYIPKMKKHLLFSFSLKRNASVLETIQKGAANTTQGVAKQGKGGRMTVKQGNGAIKVVSRDDKDALLPKKSARKEVLGTDGNYKTLARFGMAMTD